MFARMSLIAAAVAASLGAARAGDVSPADKTLIDSVIDSQIGALRHDDGTTAYGFASPTIQRIFPTVDGFMGMVRKGYPQVYRPQRYTFSTLDTDAAGRPAQHVIIVGPDGKTYEAIYSMQRQPDGSWKIDGCSIAELQGTNV